MKWNKIKEDYPKAIALLWKWGNHPAVVSRQKHRLLYDFFDEQEIYITIELEVQYTREIDEDGDNPHYVPDGFSFDIHDKIKSLVAGGVYKTRTESEEEAFTKAFEILEEKLNSLKD